MNIISLAAAPSYIQPDEMPIQPSITANALAMPYMRLLPDTLDMNARWYIYQQQMQIGAQLPSLRSAQHAAGHGPKPSVVV